MITFKRICIETIEYEDGPDKRITLERGKEYITGEEKDGEVHVFSHYWFWAPIGLFAGAKRFT